MTPAPNAEILGIRLSRGGFRRLIGAFWGINAALFLVNIALTVGWQPPLRTIAVQLDLNNEMSLATWYSSALLLLLGLGALACIPTGYQSKTRWSSLGWRVFAGLAILLSLSEVAGLHETAISSFEKYGADGFLKEHASWTLLFAPFILAAVVFMVTLFRREYASLPGAGRLVLVGVACWVGTVVLETLEYGFLYGSPVLAAVRAFEPTVEETLELAGATLILTGVLHLARWRSRRPAPEPGKA